MSAHERERLCAYLDGELSAVERAQVDAHLVACVECRERLAGMAAVDELAAGGGSELAAQPPDGYFDDFARRVRGRLETDAALAARRRSPRLPAWTWALAAALLLAVVTPLTLRERAVQPANARVARTLPPTPPAATGPAATPPAAEAIRPVPAAPAAGAPAAPAPATSAQRAPRAEAKPAPHQEHDAPEPVLQQKQSRPPAPQAADVGEGAVPPAIAPGSLASVPAREQDVPAASPAVAADVAVQGRSQELAVNRTAVLGSAAPDVAEREFRLLASRGAGGLEESRARRERWRAFVAAHPGSPRVDEARVQVIAAGLAAVRAGGGDVDRATLEQDAAQYLARADALQRPRVRALLDEAASR